MIIDCSDFFKTCIQATGEKVRGFFTVYKLSYQKKKGRTSTFLCMFDMLVNAHKHPEITCEDFILRQSLVFKYDLSQVPGGEYEFKRLFAAQRREFLTYFHQ